MSIISNLVKKQDGANKFSSFFGKTLAQIVMAASCFSVGLLVFKGLPVYESLPKNIYFMSKFLENEKNKKIKDFANENKSELIKYGNYDALLSLYTSLNGHEKGDVLKTNCDFIKLVGKPGHYKSDLDEYYPKSCFFKNLNLIYGDDSLYRINESNKKIELFREDVTNFHKVGSKGVYKSGKNIFALDSLNNISVIYSSKKRLNLSLIPIQNYEKSLIVDDGKLFIIGDEKGLNETDKLLELYLGRKEKNHLNEITSMAYDPSSCDFYYTSDGELWEYDLKSKSSFQIKLDGLIKNESVYADYVSISKLDDKKEGLNLIIYDSIFFSKNKLIMFKLNDSKSCVANYTSSISFDAASFQRLNQSAFSYVMEKQE
jgi:hypothetical protein